MAGTILSVLFWVVALGLQVGSVASGGWNLLVPGAVGVALAVVAADLARHRGLARFDWELARTLLHVLSAVTVAAFSLVWLAGLLAAGPGR